MCSLLIRDIVVLKVHIIRRPITFSVKEPCDSVNLSMFVCDQVSVAIHQDIAAVIYMPGVTSASKRMCWCVHVCGAPNGHCTCHVAHCVHV